jgi:hypothetical protein
VQILLDKAYTSLVDYLWKKVRPDFLSGRFFLVRRAPALRVFADLNLKKGRAEARPYSRHFSVTSVLRSL